MSYSVTSGELAIAYNNVNYVVTLTPASDPADFKILSPVDGNPMAVDANTAAHLFGAEQAYTALTRLYGTAQVEQMPSVWQNVINSDLAVVALNFGANELANLSGLVLGSVLTGGATVAGAASFFENLAENQTPSVVELAYVAAAVQDANSLLAQANTAYNSIQSTVSNNRNTPISYDTIKAAIDGTMISLATGSAAVQAASQIPAVDSNTLDDIIGFVGNLASVFTDAATAVGNIFNAAQVALLGNAGNLADSVGIIQDEFDLSSYIDSVYSISNALTSDASRYAPLTAGGLEQSAQQLSGHQSVSTTTYAPVYSISPDPAQLTEKSGTTSITISRTNTSQADLVYVSTVQFQTQNTNGNTYYTGLLDIPVSFGVGVASVAVPLHINDLGLSAGSETFGLIVQKSSGDPATTYLASGTFTIANTDSPPASTYSFVSSPSPVNETAGSATFTLSRTNGSAAATVYVSTVHTQSPGNPNGDYYYDGLLNMPVTFAVGQLSVAVSVTVNNVGLTSGSETFQLIAQQFPTDPTSVSLASTSFTIVNNDTSVVVDAPPVLVNGSPLSVPAGNTVTIGPGNLKAVDSDNSDAQLRYTVTAGPFDGSLLSGGVSASSFTQADIDNGLISYRETAGGASSDFFTFHVSDPAGSATSSTTFQIAIGSAPDDTPPVLATNDTLSVGVGGTAAITSAVLKATDNVSGDSQLTYTVLLQPQYGSLMRNQTSATSFTQADIDNGLISYVESSGAESSDFFTFYVTDASGNRTSTALQFEIQINAVNGIVGNGQTLNVSAGHTSAGIVVNGGTLNVLSGGTVNYTTDNAFGIDVVSRGGVEIGTTLNGSSLHFVSGTTTGTTVNGGSSEAVYSGGRTVNTTVNSRSFMTVFSGATTTGTINNDAGVGIRGKAVGDIVNSGGYTYVYSGAVASAAVINGGTLEMDFGGALAGSVSFGDQGGTLRLATIATLPSATIIGFAAGDTIDLTEVFFNGSGTTQLLANNVLQINAAGSSYDLDFDPAQSFANEQFTLTTDGYGTNLRLVPSSVGAGQPLVVSSGQVVSGVAVVSGGLVNVSSGGVISGASVSSGATEVTSFGGLARGSIVHGFQEILSGGTAFGAKLSNGGLQQLYGSAVSTTLSSGASQNIWAGGVATGTTVNDGGVENVFAGATASTTVVSDPGLEVVWSGGVTVGAVLSGGVADVFGSAIGTILSSGGILNVSSGGAVSGTIYSGGIQILASGGAAMGDVVASGFEEVQSGGVAGESTVNGSGGWQYVFAGGTVSATGLSNHGIQQVFLGGLALNTTVSAAAFLLDYGSAAFAAVSAGAQDYIESGGTGSGTQVLAAGIEQVFAGGAANATVLSNGAFQANFGAASGTHVLFGGQQYVESGGSDSGTIVSSGGVEQVLAGGVASGTTINSGGFELDYGGTVSGTTVAGGANQYVFSNGFASSTTVASGGLQYIVSGGTATGNAIGTGAYQLDYGAAIGTTLGLAAVEIVYGGAFSATVASAGLQDVISGAIASGTTVSGGGYQFVYGTASATSLLAGADQYVYSGGSANGTTVGDGGLQYIVGSGTASSVTVSSGGYQFVRGSANDTVLSGTANQFVFSGGVASATTVSSGSLQYVASGGEAGNTTVASGGLQYDYGSVTSATFSGSLGYIFSGATGSAMVLLTGATQEIFSGGTLSGGTVSSGAFEYDLGATLGMVVDGGTFYDYRSATSTTVGDGGIELVLNGAVESGASVASGGVQYDSGTVIGEIVLGGVQNVYGTASTTVVSSGYQVVIAGGTAGSTVVSSGGNIYISGTAAELLLSSGGDGIVFSGGQVSGATLGGGELEIESGGTAGSSMITISSGTLKLDDSQSFGATISGLATSAQLVDLVDIDFATVTLGYSGNTLSGTLTVGDGTHTANLALLGQYTVGSFHTANDGNGGTLITDPPVSSGSPSVLSPSQHT